MSRTFHNITDEIIACSSARDATRLILECIDIGRKCCAASKAEEQARKIRQLAPDQPDLERQAYDLTLQTETTP